MSLNFCVLIPKLATANSYAIDFIFIVSNHYIFHNVQKYFFLSRIIFFAFNLFSYHFDLLMLIVSIFIELTFFPFAYSLT